MATVLVADDEAVVRHSLGAVLKAAGYKVFDAVDGRVAPEVLGQIDAAIVDVIMPERDGLELIREIRTEYPRVRIIAMTGFFVFGEVDSLTAARQLGAHAALEKPFEMERLLRTLQGLLAKGEKA